MLIAIFSDSHDNLPNIQEAIQYIQALGIENIIHCGDVCSKETLEKILELFYGNIYVSCGNGDVWEDFMEAQKKHKNLLTYKARGEIFLDGKKIAFCHFPEEAQKQARGQTFDVIFYGHNHTPWEKRIGKTVMVNPGTLAGIYNKATFAMVETKTLKPRLILIEELFSLKSMKP